MPRIDPLKLLTCLSVLLAPNGGIRSANEVKRLANLMAKFSKKLVSKCIYIQILKCTETDLLGQFMAAGGWSLVHMWLADGITTKNWPLIQELLELLLCCPVDVERLKSNTAPKLVKSLSKDSSHEGVRLLATKLVEQWLKIARNDIRSGQVTVPATASAAPPTSAEVESSNDEPAEEQEIADQSQEEIVSETVVDEEEEEGGETIVPDAVPAKNGGQGVSEEVEENGREEDDGDHEEEEDVEGAKDDFNKAVAESNAKKAPLLFKITMKNGKQVLAKVESPTKKSAAELEESAAKGAEDPAEDVTKVEDAKKEAAELDGQLDQTDSVESVDSVDAQKVKDEKSKDKDRRKSDEKERNRDKDKSSSKDKDKHRDKDKKSSSSSSHRSSSKSSSSSSSKHNSSSGSSSSKTSKTSSSKSSSSSSSSKDKDKDRHNSSTGSNHSSSSKHKSSSSKSSSSSKGSSSSSSDKHRDHKDKDKSSSLLTEGEETFD